MSMESPTPVPSAASPEFGVGDVATAYVQLVLQLGEHDDNYVDAYYGPPQWRENVPKRPLADILADAETLLYRIGELVTVSPPPPASNEVDQLRARFLLKQVYVQAVSRATKHMDATQITALKTHAFALMPGHGRLSFDSESELLYDAVAPRLTDDTFAAVLDKLDKLLPPGAGSLIDRYVAFKDKYIIPPEKLSTVFEAAVAKTREITKTWIELPAEESFRIEYVNNKPWSGYNWYKGGYYSVIQINTDLPIYIDRAVDLAAHEGYPGHHVYNMLLEKNLYQDRGMVEFAVYPLFSPQSLIAEGSANYGIEMCFPIEPERVEFEKSVLFPLAGLDPHAARLFYEVERLIHQLSFAGNEAARYYINGDMTRNQTSEWLTKYSLMAPERAIQRIKFFDAYRSYVISYNHGLDLVSKYVEHETKQLLASDKSRSPAKARWQVFQRLLSLPQVPSNLVVESA